MKKLMLLAAMLAMAVMSMAPAAAMADDLDFDGFDDETGFIVVFVDNDFDGIEDFFDDFVDGDFDGFDDRVVVIFVDEDFDGIEDFFDAFVDADFDGFDDRFFFGEDNPCIGPDAFEDVFGECSDPFFFG